MSGLLLVAGLAACSTVGQGPGQASVASTAATGQRLQALEQQLQQLADRVDALQEAAGYTHAGITATGMDSTRVPAEARPVRPGIVLSAGTPLAAPAPAAPATPHQPPAGGDWVINLASYANASFAADKRAEFASEGVIVEQVQARVNGKQVYRLRIPGFVSYRAAAAKASVVRTVLGLESTWIARR